MKVIVLGSSGIIGQHMRLSIPEGVEAVFVRRHADPLHAGLDLTDRKARREFLSHHKPNVIVNLAGESRPDVVERAPDEYHDINTKVPGELAGWCDANGAHLIHVSTQAVFLGDNPPYGPDSATGGANLYGRQKASAEHRVKQARNWTIVRPTFVLGIRPLPFIGRANPAEQMCAGGPQKQVWDRWFSVSMARDVAAGIWLTAANSGLYSGRIFHFGSTMPMSRYELASRISEGVESVSHDSFPGIAPRPVDTTYADHGPYVAIDFQVNLVNTLRLMAEEFDDREALSMAARAREIAMFLEQREDDCAAVLAEGWDAIHNAVTADWNRARPRNDWQILDFYRRTETYIWELSHYHASPGWNYAGMCRGIAERLQAAGAKRVLCLGDGIGDLTLSLIRHGFDAHYHDLAGSRTAEFAAFRSWIYLGSYMPTRLSSGWSPELGAGEWDAIVSLDFLEHVTNVEEWVASIKAGLKPGGLFCAQNAFACGSGPEGAMPMHLARNDRFEKDWDPTLFGMGFSQESSNWYRVPADIQVAA